MKYGYARVSTTEQDTAIQADWLRSEGCTIVVEEKATGAKEDKRPAWLELKAKLVAGDSLVVMKIDRLARNTRELLNIVDELRAKQVSVKFGDLPVEFKPDDKSGISDLVLQIMGAIGEFERKRIVERTHTGRETARLKAKAEGKAFGLQPNAELYNRIQEASKSGASPTQIAKEFNISRTTVYKALAA